MNDDVILKLSHLSFYIQIKVELDATRYHCYLRFMLAAESLLTQKMNYSILLLSLSSLAAHAADYPYLDPTSIYKNWAKGEGICQFRGNPTHTHTGCGDIPTNLKILWKRGSFSGLSSEGGAARTWAGTGWTGQPSIWWNQNFEASPTGELPLLKKSENPQMEIVVGAYDYGIHFFDWLTGQDTRKAFRTGDIIKGSVSLDPDGYPLVYSGSRDNYFRILSAMPGEEPKLLWKLSAYDVPNKKWNDDWDSNASIIDDYLIEGGENSYIYVVKLNRRWEKGKSVEVNPKILVQMSTYSKEIHQKIGKPEVSIENSPILYKHFLYTANSSGRILGLDLSRIDEKTKNAPIVFDYWVGDDVDASLVVDEEGMLYVAAEQDHNTERGRSLGQLIKLDPSKNAEEALVWSIKLKLEGKSGIWATPVLHKDYIYTTTSQGDLLVANRMTGEVTHKERYGSHEWGSSVITNDRLLVPTTSPGGFRIYDLKADPGHPQLLSKFKMPSGGAIESTPLVYNGNIYVGSRDGYFYALGDADK